MLKKRLNTWALPCPDTKHLTTFFPQRRAITLLWAQKEQNYNDEQKEQNIMMLCLKITGIYAQQGDEDRGKEALVVYGKMFPP